MSTVHTGEPYYTITFSAAMDGRALKKTITRTIDDSRYPEANPELQFTLHLPAEATEPVPVTVQAAWGFGRFGPPPDWPVFLTFAERYLEP